MKNNWHLLLVLLVCSCAGYKSITGVAVSADNGLKKVSIPSHHFTITYFGDYWFHPLDPNQTLNWSDELGQIINDQKGRKILYSAHTTVGPYCSSVGVSYPDTSVHKMIRNDTILLREKYKASNLKIESRKLIGRNFYTVIKYNLRHKQLKVVPSYAEYFTKCNQFTLRFIFVTMEENKEEWFDNDT
ncbi:MAG TPA: hypothetical protein DGG95_16710, partial [Cytophagales bacterium]|nr:hypothetical protein [Cytophagales bacterium]